MLRTQLDDVDIANIDHANLLVDSILASVSYALRSTPHRTYGTAPGSLAFHRDMLLNLPIIADMALLRDKRQAVIDYSAARSNLGRRFKDYVAGDEVLVINKDIQNKMADKATGPFVVQQAHTNGTVTIIRGPGVFERVNVRRLKPYQR